MSGPEHSRCRIAQAGQPARRILPSLRLCRGLQFAVELLQLPPAFLACTRLIDLRLRVTRPGIVRGDFGACLQCSLLLHLQLLLSQCLVQLQLLKRLPLPGVSGRTLHAALILLHPQLQLVLLVLALELVLLQRPAGGIVPGSSGIRQCQEHENRGATQNVIHHGSRSQTTRSSGS